MLSKIVNFVIESGESASNVSLAVKECFVRLSLNSKRNKKKSCVLDCRWTLNQFYLRLFLSVFPSRSFIPPCFFFLQPIHTYFIVQFAAYQRSITTVQQEHNDKRKKKLHTHKSNEQQENMAKMVVFFLLLSSSSEH